MSDIWYLSGRMSGIPQCNFPRFDYAAALLRSKGFVVISPAELDDDADRKAALASADGYPSESPHTWGQYLGRDIQIIADRATGIILLDDWWESAGARLEAYAGLLRGKSFMTYSPISHETPPIHANAPYVRDRLL
ncbi:MAG: DUF4406 domain-containing protein [Patescibacteria group bacterium]|nr:DUF4406 domain-containing protein [Patescibacteria group bacterium]